MIYRISVSGPKGPDQFYGVSYWLDEKALYVRTESDITALPLEDFDLLTVEPMTITGRRVVEWPPRLVIDSLIT